MDAHEPTLKVTGGCVCGRVRYRVTAPALEVGHCHCTICRRSSGAPFVTWATFPLAAFAFIDEAPAERASSASAVRSFCPHCGTQLTFRETTRSSWIDVTVGSLDQPEKMRPEHHIFTASQLAWLRVDDDLPRHPGSDPSERQG